MEGQNCVTLEETEWGGRGWPEHSVLTKNIEIFQTPDKRYDSACGLVRDDEIKVKLDVHLG